jgi:hypothetical protein
MTDHGSNTLLNHTADYPEPDLASLNNHGAASGFETAPKGASALSRGGDHDLATTTTIVRLRDVTPPDRTWSKLDLCVDGSRHRPARAEAG